MNTYTPEEIELLKSLSPELSNRLEDPLILMDLVEMFPVENIPSALKRIREGRERNPVAVDEVEKVLLEEPLTEMPLHLYEESRPSISIIAKWRLMIGH